MLDGLLSILRSAPDVQVTAAVKNGKEALRVLEENVVDVVLTDISMPVMNGYELAKEIRARFPGVKVIALSMFGDSVHIQEMLDAGVKGYIYKNASNEELLSALRKVQDGGVYYSEEIAAEMMRTLHRDHAQKQELERVSLTEREVEIMKLVAQEYSNAKIAEALYISERTVETHRKNIYKKTGTNTIVGLIKWAYSNGVLE